MEEDIKTQSRSDLGFLAAITAILLVAIAILIGTGNRYGSAVDWASQHSVLPDVFRQHFYQTGELMPDFLPEIGAGQNAFNFAYYGMMNPVILPSYLLPWVSMVTYVEVVSVLLLISSVWLFHAWLRGIKRHGSELGTSLSDTAIRFATALFAFATPLLYHSHKQVVYVAYIPFLLLGLMGVDRYFLKRRGDLLACMVTLLFLTSYLHAVPSVVVLTIYGVYRWWTLASPENASAVRVHRFLPTAIRFALHICAGIAAAGALLVPTLLAVMAGRSPNVEGEESLISLLLPEFPMHEALYAGYGLGMTAIVLYAALSLLFRSSKEEKPRREKKEKPAASVIPKGDFEEEMRLLESYAEDGKLPEDFELPLDENKTVVEEKTVAFIGDKEVPAEELLEEEEPEENLPPAVTAPERFLAGSLLLVCVWPFARYILNGFLYSREKALIPFIPLAALLIAMWFTKEFRGKRDAKLQWLGRSFPANETGGIVWITFALAVAWAFFSGYYEETFLFTADWILLPVLIVLAHRKNTRILTVFTAAFALVVTVYYSTGDTLLTRKEASKLHSEAKAELFAQAYDADGEIARTYRSNDLSASKLAANAVYDSRYRTTGFYSSVYNRDYLEMVYGYLKLANPTVNDISLSPQSDWTFQTLMGVRYILTDRTEIDVWNNEKVELPSGYVPVASKGDFTVARSEDAYAMAFLPDAKMSFEQYLSLTPVQRRIALLRYAVVQEDLPEVSLADDGVEPELMKSDLRFDVSGGSEDLLMFPTLKGKTWQVYLGGDMSDYLWFVETRLLQMREHRTEAIVQNIANTLSGTNNARPNGNYNFLFAVSSANDSFLLVELPNQGDVWYEPFSVSRVPMESLRALRKHVTMATDIRVDADGTLSGRISAKEAGTMIITYPWADGFTVTVDGQRVSAFIADGGLIGCDVPAGEHEFCVTFRATGHRFGNVVSILGLLALAGIVIVPAVWRRREVPRE
ncbi:MAG: YfhO family protein [Lachnospiraceae bacterium]|nr:YfhO family protein [Lachnospiraceae bacterium]